MKYFKILELPNKIYNTDSFEVVRNVLVLSKQDLLNFAKACWQESELCSDKMNGFDVSDAETDEPIAKDSDEFVNQYLKLKNIVI